MNAVAIYRQLALCERVRCLRERQHLTQSEVAEQLAISQAAYCRLERGDIEFAVSKLFELADMYGVSASKLLEGL
jgi:transcriptional regulator with XRE-family HTH domain